MFLAFQPFHVILAYSNGTDDDSSSSSTLGTREHTRWLLLLKAVKPIRL